MLIISGDGEMLRVSDVARALGVSEQTIRMWDKKGILKPSHIMGRGMRIYSKEKIEKFIQERDKKNL